MLTFLSRWLVQEGVEGAVRAWDYLMARYYPAFTCVTIMLTFLSRWLLLEWVEGAVRA